MQLLIMLQTLKLKRLLIALSVASSLGSAGFPLSAVAQTQENEPIAQETNSSPIETSVVYTFDFASVMGGGLKTGSVGLGVLNASASANLEQLNLANGLTLYGHILGTHGLDLSPYAGDAQTASNIEAPADTLKIYQAWLQQELFNGQISLLFGIYDLNSEFYTTDSSSLFINSSFGIGKDLSQTGPNGPSIFPVTGVGFRVKGQIAENFALTAAIIEAVPGDPNQPNGTVVDLHRDEGSIRVIELNYFPAQESGTKAGIGLWRYSEQFPHSTETQSNGDPTLTDNQGFYLLMESSLSESTRGFVRYGRATEGVNEFASNLAVGVTSSATFLNRPNDEIGFALTTAQASESFVETLRTSYPKVEDRETTYELTYRYQLNQHFSSQPSFQFIRNPGLGVEADDATVVIIRLNAEI